MFKHIIFTLFYIQQIQNQNDEEDLKKPYLTLTKEEDSLIAIITNNDNSDVQFFQQKDDQGIVNQNFNYSEEEYNIVLMLPAQNIQRVSFQFQSSCKLPIVYSVKKNNQYTYSIKSDTNMEMYYTSLGQNDLQSAQIGSTQTFENILKNDYFIDVFNNQEIVYDIQEVSRQIAVVCLIFDPDQNYRFEFQANIEKYQIQNQEKNQNMDTDDQQDFELSLPPQTSYDVIVTTDANELKLTFDYDSDSLEYQVIQFKSDKSIEYIQQSVINVVGIGPEDVIKVLLLNTGNQKIDVFITAETYSNNESEFPKWAIILISIIGAFILIIIIIIVVVCCKKKNKKNKSKDYPEAPEEFNKEKAKIVKQLPENEIVEPNMVSSRVHYPEFKEDDQTNIDVFTVQLKEEEMNIEYPSNVIKEFSNKNKQQ